jgi:hypothetical protein
MIANLATMQYSKEKKFTTYINGIMWNNERIQIPKARDMENEENFSFDVNFVAFIFHVKLNG